MANGPYSNQFQLEHFYTLLYVCVHAHSHTCVYAQASGVIVPLYAEAKRRSLAFKLMSIPSVSNTVPSGLLTSQQCINCSPPAVCHMYYFSAFTCNWTTTATKFHLYNCLSIALALESSFLNNYSSCSHFLLKAFKGTAPLL